MSAPDGNATLWTVVVAGGSALIGLFSAAIGHLHMRISGLDARIDDARKADEARHQADEDRRSSSNREIWIELRRMSEADREHRERILTRLNELPTRDEVYEALDRHVGNGRPRRGDAA